MMILAVYFVVQEELNKAYLPKGEVASYLMLKTSRGDLMVRMLSRVQKM